MTEYGYSSVFTTAFELRELEMNNKIYKTMAYDQIKQQLRQYLVSAAGNAELKQLI